MAQKRAAKKAAKKTRAKKELAGTVERSRERKLKPPPKSTETQVELPPSFGKAPDFLSTVKGAERIYYDLARHVHSVKALWSIDSYVVAQAAYWIALGSETIKDAKGEFIQTFQTGAKQISPQFQIIDKAETHIKKYFDMLGIGMKAREAIEAFSTGQGDDAGNDDPVTELMKKLNKARQIDG